MLEQASSYAASIDGLILLIGVLVAFWLLAAEGIFLLLLFTFRKKEGSKSRYISGDEKHLKRWITVPHLFILIFDLMIVVAAVEVWYDVKLDLPEADSIVRVTGQQWAWVFQHPGSDNRLDTSDDIWTTDELHVQVNRTYHFELESRDVLHSFSVPVFRLKQDAVPGRRITGWFEPTRVGTYDIQCAEICGLGHGVMAGRIFVEVEADHSAWVAERTPAPDASVGLDTAEPDRSGRSPDAETPVAALDRQRM